MGKFTKYSGKADKYVEEKLKIVTKEIAKAIPNVYSVILMGGYARGEGALEIKKGKAEIINDFDLYVITKKQISDEFLEKLALRCSRLIGKGGIAHPEGFEQRYDFEKFFHVDIRCIPRNKLKRLPPTIRYFEMAYAGAVLYGKNLLSEFPRLKPQDIPVPEALRIIMNRMMLLLMAFWPRFIKNPKTMSNDEKGILNYYIAKSYLTCCEALLILAGQFRPTYTGRADLFSKIYKRRFPSLARQFPDLAKKVIFFTDYKISPKPETVDPIKEWFECREVLGEVFKFCTANFLKTKLGGNWIRIKNILKKKLGCPYFNPYAKYFLRRYYLNNFLLRYLLNRLAQIYMEIKYLFKLKQDLGKFYWPALSLNDPGIKILYMAPLILYSIDKNGNENKVMIKEALRELRKVYPVKKTIKWGEAKTLWMKAYRLYYLQRFV